MCGPKPTLVIVSDVSCDFKKFNLLTKPEGRSRPYCLIHLTLEMLSGRNFNVIRRMKKKANIQSDITYKCR